MDEEAGAGRLTDNEKAATFIGWKPDKRCGRAIWLLLEGCPDCDYWGDLGEHDVPCPLMSLPKNYMRALETLPDNRWPDMCLHENRHWHCSIWNQWDNDIGSHAIYWGGDGETCGEAVVKALAALYDAEHPDVLRELPAARE